jgi:hypothetical protein
MNYILMNDWLTSTNKRIMLVVDDVVFSMEVWDWYHNRKDNLSLENDTNIKVFRPWMKEKYNSGSDYIQTYGELSGWDFYELLHNIFMLFTDIHLTPMDGQYTTADMFIELKSIENQIIYWALTEGHNADDFGKEMRNELLNSNTMSFNRKFHVESCYKMKCIWQGHKELVEILDNVVVSSLPGIDIFTMENIIDDTEIDEFMKMVIKESCGHDFDEFIISVMERMKFNKIKQYHEKLAMVKGYEIFGIEDFETKLSYSETWRRLFPAYFDEVEDVFSLFYENFLGPCILHIYNDYLSWDHNNVKYIPIYKLYGDPALNRVSTNIRYFIKPADIKKRILKLYKIRIGAKREIVE